MNTNMINHVVMEKVFSVIARFEKTLIPTNPRFEDSLEVRFQKEDERIKMIEAEIWFLQQSTPTPQEPTEEPTIIEGVELVVKTKTIKRTTIKTINIIYALLLIGIVLFFCQDVDFNLRDY